MIDNIDQNIPSSEPNQSESSAKPEEVEPSAHTTPAEEFNDSVKHFINNKSRESNDKKLNDPERLQEKQIFNFYNIGGNYVGAGASVHGDVAGRDQKKRTTVAFTSNSAKGLAVQVSKEDIDKIRSVYVNNATYTQAKKIIYEKHILTLWGEQNLGKWTTAIHLLSSLPVDEIYKIDPEMEDLHSFQYEKKQGYVIDTLVIENLEKISIFVLDVLSQKLREHDSYLIITINSREQVLQKNFGRYVVKAIYRRVTSC